MANLNKVVYLSNAQAQELFANGTITVDGITVTYSPNDLYVTPSGEVTDVQVNGVSVLGQNGVANIPIANTITPGVVKTTSWGGVSGNSGGEMSIVKASDAQIKAGINNYKPIVPSNQEQSVFYGLAKLAGADMASLSSVTVGEYPDAQKIAIQKMLGITPIGNFEEIVRYTVPENATSVTVDTDINGLPFKLAEAEIIVRVGPTTTGTNDYISGSIKDSDGVSISLPTLRVISGTSNTSWLNYHFTSRNGCAFLLAKASSGGNSQNATFVTYSTSSNGVVHANGVEGISGITLTQYNSTSTLIPAGAEIIIAGCRLLD